YIGEEDPRIELWRSAERARVGLREVMVTGTAAVNQGDALVMSQQLRALLAASYQSYVVIQRLVGELQLAEQAPASEASLPDAATIE
ncbi:MAG: hypothetical protein ACREBW_03125, partial [Candidatus Micrarchaeaceae archaeon]